MNRRQRLGQLGEQAAVEHLTGLGYTILDRNWRYGRSGEIDVVARDGDCLVIVEVRARRGKRFGSPEESVTAQKQARLAALTEAYCFETDWDGPVRIDVIALRVALDDDTTQINHIQNAV